MKTLKSVVVIGAGASGLMSVKSCLESGLEVTCYEITNGIGGLWKFRENNPDHVSCLQKSTIINSSKEMSAISDFPPPADFSNFMHNKMFWEYLMNYATSFKLLPHIKFNNEVTSVEMASDYLTSGKWIISGRNVETNQSWQKEADAVMVCNGHLAKPNMPDFKGLASFKGEVIHTREYKRPHKYDDKNVLVVGVGNSGGDAAVEISTVTKNLYLCVRTGSWVFSRVGQNGEPSDMAISRILSKLISICPSLTATFLQSDLNKKFDHKLYGLKPKNNVLQQHPMVNDDLPNRITSGRIKVKGAIDYFTEDGVYFEGDSTKYEVDAVVMATGYLLEFPFLDDEVLNFNSKENLVKLYKYILPPHLKHPTLGVIGLIQPFGSVIPLAEAQARWFVQLFHGNFQLPSKEQMEKSIESTEIKLFKRFKKTTRYTLEVDWLAYLDDITKDFGASPNLLHLLLTDPKLFFSCMFGATLPYQFRLSGPHKWKGARNAIMTVRERVERPFMKRPDQPLKKDSFFLRNFLVTATVAIFFLLYVFVCLKYL